MKKQGYVKEEINKSNASKDFIYSYKTFVTYMAEINKFGEWLIKEGYGKITLENAKEFIQPYIDYQTNRGLSSYSINTSLSTLCKCLHENIRDYDHPLRSVLDIKRYKFETPRDKSNVEKYQKILNYNRILGLRRNELLNLKARDFKIEGNLLIIYIKGKGGKYHEITFTNDKKEKLLPFFVLFFLFHNNSSYVL